MLRANALKRVHEKCTNVRVDGVGYNASIYAEYRGFPLMLLTAGNQVDVFAFDYPGKTSAGWCYVDNLKQVFDGIDQAKQPKEAEHASEVIGV